MMFSIDTSESVPASPLEPVPLIVTPALSKCRS